MLNHQGVDIKLLAELFPEHCTALAKDFALVRRLEIEGINWVDMSYSCACKCACVVAGAIMCSWWWS